MEEAEGVTRSTMMSRGWHVLAASVSVLAVLLFLQSRSVRADEVSAMDTVHGHDVWKIKSVLQKNEEEKPWVTLGRLFGKWGTAEGGVCEEHYGILPCSVSLGGNAALLVIYGYMLLQAAQLLSDGSELLLTVMSPGIIGGLVLPILGAFPDALLITGKCPLVWNQQGVGFFRRLRGFCSVVVLVICCSEIMFRTFPGQVPARPTLELGKLLRCCRCEKFLATGR